MPFADQITSTLDTSSKLVAQHLIDFAKSDPVFAEKLEKTSITNVMSYIQSQAAKLPRKGNMAMADDNTVYGWAVHAVDENIQPKQEEKAEVTSEAKSEVKSAKPKKAPATVATPVQTVVEALQDPVKISTLQAENKAYEKRIKALDKEMNQWDLFTAVGMIDNSSEIAELKKRIETNTELIKLEKAKKKGGVNNEQAIKRVETADEGTSSDACECADEDDSEDEVE